MRRIFGPSQKLDNGVWISNIQGVAARINKNKDIAHFLVVFPPVCQLPAPPVIPCEPVLAQPVRQAPNKRNAFCAQQHLYGVEWADGYNAYRYPHLSSFLVISQETNSSMEK